MSLYLKVKDSISSLCGCLSVGYFVRLDLDLNKPHASTRDSLLSLVCEYFVCLDLDLNNKPYASTGDSLWSLVCEYFVCLVLHLSRTGMIFTVDWALQIIMEVRRNRRIRQ